MGATVSLFVNATEIYHFKTKVSKTRKYPLCLWNILGDFSVDNMKKARLNGCVYDFSVDYIAFDTSNIIHIHKYLMKKQYIK